MLILQSFFSMEQHEVKSNAHDKWARSERVIKLRDNFNVPLNNNIDANPQFVFVVRVLYDKKNLYYVCKYHAFFGGAHNDGSALPFVHVINYLFSL